MQGFVLPFVGAGSAESMLPEARYEGLGQMLTWNQQEYNNPLVQ